MRIGFLAIVAFLALAGTSCAQVVGDRPKIYVPKKPPTRREIDQRDSLHKYVEGLWLQRQERPGDALKAFEEAARLDPDAAAVVKAQVPILVAMNRVDDALAACKKTLALDPGDFKTWYAQAKLFRSTARYPEAIASLERGLKSAAIADHPEAAQAIYFDLGELYEEAGKHGLAADALNKAAAILEQPDLLMTRGDFQRTVILARAADTYEKIGELSRKAKRHDDALTAYAKAQKLAPQRAERISYSMAQVALEQGAFKTALGHVDVYLQTRPLNIDAYELKVDLLRRLKQPERIVPWLEQAAGREQHNAPMQLLLAKELAAAKHARKAEALYRKLADDAPSAEAFRGLFHLYKDEAGTGVPRILDMLDQAIDKARQGDGPVLTGESAQRTANLMMDAVRGDGDLAQKLVEAAFKQKAEQKQLKYHTVYFLAVLADRHRKTEEAERFYRRCLKEAVPANEALIYGGLLRTLAKARKHEAIVEVCREGLKSARATNPLLFYNDLAKAQAGLKHFDDALKTAEEGMAQAGDNSQLVFKTLRVRILTMAERHAEAETECKALIKANPKPGDVVELRYLLANAYSGAKQQAKSQEQLQIILKIDPDNATANNDLGYLWADQGKNLEEAETMIRRALELDRSERRRRPNFTLEEEKDNASYVDSLGWVLFRRGKIDEARKELERALSLADSDDPVIHDHLGDVYLRLKLRPEAIRAWQRALDLYQQGIRKDAERVRDLERKIEQAK
jgi:tetratricopeptide (TPR) repeat protein